jgi:maltose alpha-D-glucosyltransferase/alpha-amylase
MTHSDDTPDLATPPAVRARTQSEAEPAHEDDVALGAPAHPAKPEPPAGHPAPPHRAGRPEGLDAEAMTGAMSAKVEARTAAATAGIVTEPEVVRAPPAGVVERRGDDERRHAERRGHAPAPFAPLPEDPLWYKDAVVYQIHIKSYRDANGDGFGDFRGLCQKLDYIKSLGATTIWLLPFYPSPLKDDGYDIAAYEAINPTYGSIEDFHTFMQEAHARGIRVVTELVINHTSDQHPWFQRARKAPKGSPERDFYVWSDDPNKYEGTRIIFTDTETSNWTWDPVAQQFFWHRFFSHQPDLNFDNPAVRQAVINIMKFWLRLGVDGLRLDAIPYLIEREGTNCENLPETHVVLKELRAAMDEEFGNRVFLAEANQWPPDVRPYFGDGDECHMAFHFPLMPRMYMALRREDATPILEIMRQTPPIPENCQWAIFLRNHDELTLEMVTNEERDYMYREYAKDPRMRINVGIRRRLAPLLDNGRRQIEMMNALLLSMPGTPIIYYGDELGMGDNIYLGDRNGVRTPMQWTDGKNAGFSEAPAQALYSPIIVDPPYGFQTINVEAEERTPTSLLRWMRRIIGVRQKYKAFGRGSWEPQRTNNRAVLCYLRRHEQEVLLCVHNLSRFAQAVELDLTEFNGWTPVELWSEKPFPKVGELTYLLTMGPHGFYWFRLDRGEA